MKTISRYNKAVAFTALLLAGIMMTASAQPGHFGRFGGFGYRGGGFGAPYRVAPAPYYGRTGIGIGVHIGGGGYYPGRPAYGFGYGGYSPFYGPRYYGGLPAGSLSLSFGGNPYFYFGGSYYRPFDGYYRSVFPPVGLRIGILPPGYSSFYMGPDPYYYYNGSYYRPYSSGGYEVTGAPLGAVLHHLPDAARRVTVNGEPFYNLNGTYYKAGTDADGNPTYTVVGTNGNISNTPGNNDDSNNSYNNNDNGNGYNNNGGNSYDQDNASTPRIGDTVSELPVNTRTITLDGKTLYVSPDDTYYRRDAAGAYTIVGVAGQAEAPGNGGAQQ